MKISYNWLREYVEHDLAPGALAERLTMLGLEVEEVLPFGTPLDGIVVGKVLNVREHPNADKLVLCDVQLAEGDDAVQIACGAPNVAGGQKVPIATVGTTLTMPSDDGEETSITVEERELRGEVSAGMICSERELGLSEDHSGILVLDDGVAIGTPFTDYLAKAGVQPEDAVLDIDLTPNRPDAASHLGVARDVAAWAGVPLKRPPVDVPDTGGETADRVRVRIESPEACPRYAAMIVENVEIGPSPLWLRRRLSAIGITPRNNVVDVTNYVMHAFGQPLHAFDLDRLQGNEIVIRQSEAETSFTTLDGEEHTVPSGALFIRDAERPIALAGIMGGNNSEVTEETSTILIESAYFDPATIRKTAKLLNLSTDSSYRFERGIDTERQRWAAAYAAELIQELAGGTVLGGCCDEQARSFETREITLRAKRTNQVLGTDIQPDAMERILNALGVEIQSGTLASGADAEASGQSGTLKQEAIFTCRVPSFRPDISREIDLIEEVARLHGYDAIPNPAHTKAPAKVERDLPADRLRKQTRALLKGYGYREMYTNSMLPEEVAERFNAPELQGGVAAGPVVQTLKPISKEMAALRPSLLPGALQVMQHNTNHGQTALRFYEFGHVFRKTDRSDTVIPGYAEHESFLIGLSGARRPAHWSTSQPHADFFDLKGIVEGLLAELEIPHQFEPLGQSGTLATYGLDIQSNDTPLGACFKVDEETAADFDLERPVFIAELDWSAITALAPDPLARTYTPVSRFPVVERDLAILVDANQPVGALLEAIYEAAGQLLNSADVFDLYEGEGVPEDKKSIAFTLEFGANRTLTDREVDEQMEAILQALKSHFGAELRG